MFTSEFAIRFMVDKRSAVSAKALLKFWIAVSVSAFMCSPPSPLLGSMSSSSGVSKSSSRDTGSRITERPAADLRYVEQGERDEQRGPLSESHHRDGPRPLASRRLDSRHNDRLRPLQQLIPEAAPDKIDLELRRRARHIEVQRTCPYSQGAPCFNP